MAGHARDSRRGFRASSGRPWRPEFASAPAARAGPSPTFRWSSAVGWSKPAVSTGPLPWPQEMSNRASATLARRPVSCVQCGTKVSKVNERLETVQRKRALRTSGASNGQTIGGMIGTGVHGSAIGVGGLESQVAGLQLLTASQNLWIEPARAPDNDGCIRRQAGRDFGARQCKVRCGFGRARRARHRPFSAVALDRTLPAQQFDAAYPLRPAPDRAQYVDIQRLGHS